jgi:two-component system nitrogen regulation response regulator NtrX
VDVRVLAATNKDLEEEIEEGRFRDDLYFRLNVVPIDLPPLRERPGDIPLLVEHFAAIASEQQRLPARTFTTAALDRLAEMPWPGNVRELRNTVERLMILSAGDEIDEGDIQRIGGAGREQAVGAFGLLQARSFADFKAQSERAYILARLREYDWNVSETARSIDMPRSNLYKKIEKYGIEREDTS